MTSIRYVPGKIWLTYAGLVALGIVIVIALNVIDRRGSLLPGGIGALTALTVMLLPGAIKRSSRREPVVIIDDRGITIDVLGIGTIGWDRIRLARLVGSPWVNGRKIIIEYIGAAPKLGMMQRLNWGIFAKPKGEMTKMTVGYIEQTDQSKLSIEAALRRAPLTAA